jgi:CRP-like cAMP-binding protein
MTKSKISPELLRKIPIFSSLTEQVLAQIIQSPDNRVEEYAAKQTIVRESEIGTCMYVVLEGMVEVFIRGAGGGIGREICIATLKKGDFFGDQSLNTDSTGRRSASVRALHPARVFRIDKKHVQLQLHRGGPDEEPAATEDIQSPAPPIKQSEAAELIKGLRLFQSLKPAELESIDTWTTTISVGPGEFVLKESQKGECLYVILEGTVEIFTFDDDGRVVLLATLGKGEHFGEQALMPGGSGQRNAYARTSGIARLIQVPKAYFRLLLNRDSALAQALQRIGEKQKTAIDQIQHK